MWFRRIEKLNLNRPTKTTLMGDGEEIHIEKKKCDSNTRRTLKCSRPPLRDPNGVKIFDRYVAVYRRRVLTTHRDLTLYYYPYVPIRVHKSTDFNRDVRRWSTQTRRRRLCDRPNNDDNIMFTQI